MALFDQVSFGSIGSSVKKLQKQLNQYGANLSVDGIFGEKTKQAVMDFQNAKDLVVDGIVGSKTWGALNNLYSLATGKNSSQPTAGTTNSSASSPTSSSSSSNPTQSWSYDDFKVSDATAAADQKRQELASQKPGEFTYGAYEKSDVVKQAEALLQQQLANKPGEYTSPWQSQLNDIIAQIQNREKFSYDLNGDALYQQYKDQYTNQGKMAMMDTMGQAQAMTGGYGSSYAQSVGQQAYQGYLQQLNDKAPELYQLALNQYNAEGDNMYNQASLIAGMENQEYGRYRDSVSDYYTELDRLTNDSRYQSEQDYNRYLDAYNMAYGQHRDSVSDWQQAQNRADQEYWNQYNKDYSQYADDRNLAYDNYWNDKNLSYRQDRDKVADEQWQKEYDEALRQYNQNFQYQQDRDAVADSQWNQSFQYQQDRDAVADKQWQDSFDYQKDRDAVSDSQWNQSFQYQQDRDAVADSQWQSEFDEAMRQYNQNLQYQQDRDKVADEQWNQSFQYQQDRDAVSDSQWDKSFQYQQDRDAVADQQWNQSFQYQQDRDTVADSQWQAQFDEAKRQYDEQMAISQNKDSSTSDTDGDEPPKKGYDNEGLTDAQIKSLQTALGLDADGKWGPNSRKAAGGLGAKDAYNAWKQGKLGQQEPFEEGSKLTYSDVALTAAQMRKAGASKQEINQYLNEVVQSSNYTPTNSVSKDLLELKAGYVGSGR